MADNIKRNRYYGLRIGDKVQYKVPGISLPNDETIYEIVEYGYMDNNRVILVDKNGEKHEAVAEWCKIIEKADNRVVEIPYEDLLKITAIIDRAIAEKESRGDICQIGVFKEVAQWLHGGKYNIVKK